MILVTGGAGYIGSHTVRKMLERNFEVAILDNLSRGHIESVPGNVTFINCNLNDSDKLERIFSKYKFTAIIHFAAYTYVGESVENPKMYYENNVLGSLNLINSASQFNVKNFVFSSTCSVYGNPLNIPITEYETVKPINPYAKTKSTIENILEDFRNAYGMNYITLRYFNASGCSDDSSIGESHFPEPHLIPIVLNNALGKNEKVLIFGNDYPTEDGTCIRDYIHVNDLADAHILSLDYLISEKKSDIINLGTGNGFSVNEIIKSAEIICEKKINTEYAPRRSGDPAILVADNSKAKEILGWSAEYDLNRILKTAWEWHRNPKF